jgi:hypothetical protein
LRRRDETGLSPKTVFSVISVISVARNTPQAFKTCPQDTFTNTNH